MSASPCRFARRQQRRATPASRPLIANAARSPCSPGRRACAPSGSPRPPRASGRRSASAAGTAPSATSSTASRRPSLTMPSFGIDTDADLHGLGQPGARRSFARRGAHDQDRQVLQHVADRERAISRVGGFAPRSGPERHPLHRRARRRSPQRSSRGRRPARRRREQDDRVRADHDQLAVGEVDEAHDPEDERDPEREQREEAAEVMASMTCWRKSGHRYSAHARYVVSKSSIAQDLVAGAAWRRSARCGGCRHGRRTRPPGRRSARRAGS